MIVLRMIEVVVQSNKRMKNCHLQYVLKDRKKKWNQIMYGLLDESS